MTGCELHPITAVLTEFLLCTCINSEETETHKCRVDAHAQTDMKSEATLAKHTITNMLRETELWVIELTSQLLNFLFLFLFNRL